MLNEKYILTHRHREISGFGGNYEQECRNLFAFACRCMEPYALEEFIFDENQLHKPVSKPAIEMIAKIRDRFPDITHAMAYASIYSALLVKQRGWEWYESIMRLPGRELKEVYIEQINNLFGWDAETLADLGFGDLAAGNPQDADIRSLELIANGMQDLARGVA